MPYGTTRFSRTAFTLVELLVVVAIIAILAAILFPVFAHVREKARQATCASNLRQLGLAFAQYEEDYDGVLPFGERQATSGSQSNPGVPCIYNPPNVQGVWWPQAIGPYTTVMPQWLGVQPWFRENSIYLCPDNNKYAPLPSIEPQCSGNPMTSYTANGNNSLLAVQFNMQNVPTPLEAIQRPSDVVLLTEINNGSITAPWNPLVFWGTPSKAHLSIHDQTTNNNLYVDGHVKLSQASNEVADPDDMWGENSL